MRKKDRNGPGIVTLSADCGEGACAEVAAGEELGVVEDCAGAAEVFPKRPATKRRDRKRGNFISSPPPPSGGRRHNLAARV